ncbi:NADPH-dependent FMN reductase [Roseococcus sp. DSY-14]|uniref:NADPH-dependent FMN reductase n=1 Tax=Roseococcus sp. DSY-14 TaxID=3369650 RepID=UPI00387A855E
MPRILALCGSLRAASLNRRLLRAGIAMLPAGVEAEIADWRDLPVYDEDLEAQGMPAPVAALRAQAMAAQGFLFATPEYNWSIPGGLKNAIDWLSRKPDGTQPFAGKPVALMGATPGPGGTVNAQSHLRQVLYLLGGQVLPPPGVFVQGAGGRFDDAGAITDEPTRKAVETLMAALGKAVA